MKNSLATGRGARAVMTWTTIFLALFLKGYPQTYEGYTLYAPQDGTKAYLLNMSGTNYQTWSFSSGTTCYSSYYLPGGYILRSIKHSGNYFSGGPVSGEVQKANSSGNPVWDFVYSTTDYCSHHDIHPMPNGNVLLIAYERKTATQVSNAGGSFTGEMWPDKIVEIQPSGSTGGIVVWEWHVWDHLCQSLYPSKSNYVTSVVQHPELININYNPSQDWMHCNGIDYNAALDQIVFSSHNLNEVYVIDHSTTTAQAATHTGGNSGKGGDILYRWGNPAAYQASGTTIFNVVHDAHWVPSYCPNYPNSLCAFNNKGGTGTKSCVDIFTPPYNGYNYTITPGSAFTPSTYTWRHTYSGSYTQDMGSSQQFPNGNMLICIAQSGYLYEINSSQTVVWSKSTGTTVPKSYRYPPCYVTGTFTATATATPSSLCAGSSTQLNVTATGGTVYGYSWSSNPSGFTSSIQNPVVSPASTTTYNVTITNGPCSATGSVTVTVNPLPAAVAGANRAICSGQSTQIGATAVAGSTYSWSSSPAGFTSTLANPTVSPTVTTIYTVVETVSATGCSASHAVTVTVNPLPSAIAGTNATICAGESVQLGASPVTGNTYSWTSSPAGFISTLSNPEVSPAVTTTYTLTETITATGCSQSNPVTITVNPLPDAYAGPDRSICPGASTQIGGTAVSGNTYDWSSEPRGFTSGQSDPTVSPTVNTLYILTETNPATGCFNSNNVTISISPLPGAAGSITGPTEVEQGQTGVPYIVPIIADATGYSWTLPPGASVTAGSNTNAITVSFDDNAASGTLYVQGTNPCGNGTVSPGLAITVGSSVPDYATLNNTTIPSGQSECFDALQTITLGGGGGNFSVNAGGSVHLIAGVSIGFLPYSAVSQGGYLLGHITTTQDFCGSKSPALPQTAAGEASLTPETGEAGLFRIYPNPSEGHITLELRSGMNDEPVSFSVISFQGSVVYRDTYLCQKTRNFTLENLAPGLYLVRVTNGNRSGNMKILLQ